MHLQGTAFLALWNDVDPAREAEYAAWHTHEHVPERVAIVGMIAGRRYQAAERALTRYFTLYDLASLAVLDGAAYAAVVAQPTPWSRSMRPALTRFLRAPCARIAGAGRATGGSVATVRLDGARAGIDARALQDALGEGVDRDGIVAVHLGAVAAGAPFPLANADDPFTAARQPHVLIVEAVDRAALAAATPAFVTRLAGLGFASLSDDRFDLALEVTHRAAATADGGRPPPREALRARWHSA